MDLIIYIIYYLWYKQRCKVFIYGFLTARNANICWASVMSEEVSGIINPDVVVFVWISGTSDVNKMDHKVMDQFDAFSRRLATSPANLKINHLDCWSFILQLLIQSWFNFAMCTLPSYTLISVTIYFKMKYEN